MILFCAVILSYAILCSSEVISTYNMPFLFLTIVGRFYHLLSLES